MMDNLVKGHVSDDFVKCSRCGAQIPKNIAIAGAEGSVLIVHLNDEECRDPDIERFTETS